MDDDYIYDYPREYQSAATRLTFCANELLLQVQEMTLLLPPCPLVWVGMRWLRNVALHAVTDPSPWGLS